MSDASVTHLVGRLAVVHARVRRVVEAHRADDPDADDRFRGLYISEAEVDRLIASPVRPPLPGGLDDDETAWLTEVESRAGPDVRLRGLARAFELDELDVELLLICMAPDLDPRFERLYAYLHDDVSRRRASTGLALELCGAELASIERRRLGPASALVAGGLVVVEEPERPFLTRSLRVPDRVTAHLLGDDTPDPGVRGLVVSPVAAPYGDVGGLAAALAAGVRLVYLREPAGGGGGGMALAAAAVAAASRAAVFVDLGLVGTGDDLLLVAAAAGREGRLRDAAVVMGPVEVAVAGRGTEGVRALASAGAPTVFLIGTTGWDPQWSSTVPLLLETAPPTEADRQAMWRAAVDGWAAPGFDPAAATEQFRLGPQQVEAAASSARIQAVSAGTTSVGAAELRAGARAQNAAGLERLARRVVPSAGWDDLVLPPHVAAQLHELTSRVRHREPVLQGWGMGGRAAAGGIKALFAGDSGTGKTLSAEVVAGSLGLDLYVIDLSTVVDKYIGETEKNLDRIFAEADRVNGVLLFDEADALFGKRSEVRDAHDRYANVEVAFLLQRMERFEGLAVLTTNLRSNLDDAFARRLDAIIDFPVPDEVDRLHLWTLHLPLTVPRSDDVDLGFLAGAFKVSGGNIRNICLTGAYLAAGAGRPVAMADLVRGTEREYRKLGHLCGEGEFGPYYQLVSGGGR